MIVSYLGNYETDSKSTSTETSISTAVMEQIVESLKTHCIRESTRNNYYKIWTCFNRFFIKLDRKPDTWEDRLTLFIAYMVDKNRKSTTIRSYISAIKTTLRMHNIVIHEDTYLLSSLIRACKIQNDRVTTRLPIGKHMLHMILKDMRNQQLKLNQPYLAQLYTAMLITCFYGMFRIGEIAKGAHSVLG